MPLMPAASLSARLESDGDRPLLSRYQRSRPSAISSICCGLSCTWCASERAAALEEEERPGLLGRSGAATQGERRACTCDAQARPTFRAPARRADRRAACGIAEEDPEMAAELEDQVRASAVALDALEEEALFLGRYDAGDALVTLQRGAGGTDARTGRRWCCGWRCAGRGRSRLRGRIARGVTRRGGGHQVGDVRRQGRRTPTACTAAKGVHRLVRLSPFDAAHRRQTSFAGVEVSPS